MFGFFSRKTLYDQYESTVNEIKKFISQNKNLKDSKPYEKKVFFTNLTYVQSIFSKLVSIKENLSKEKNQEEIDLLSNITHSYDFMDILYLYFKNNNLFKNLNSTTLESEENANKKTNLKEHIDDIEFIKYLINFNSNFYQLYKFKPHLIKTNMEVSINLLLDLLSNTNDINPIKETIDLVYQLTNLFNTDDGYYFYTYELKNKDYSILVNLVYSILMNYTKNDHLFQDSNFKKTVRKSIINIFQASHYETFCNSEYFINSFFSEILIGRLCIYFEMIPFSFDLTENSPTLDISFNIKENFQCMFDEVFEFREFIFFFSKLYDSIRDINLKEQIKLLFFNWFLVELVQERLLSKNLKVFRSTMQYLIFIMMNTKSNEINFLIYFFVFGFPDSITQFKIKKQGFDGLFFMKELEKIQTKLFLSNNSLLDNKEIENQSIKELQKLNENDKEKVENKPKEENYHKRNLSNICGNTGIIRKNKSNNLIEEKEEKKSEPLVKKGSDLENLSSDNNLDVNSIVFKVMKERVDFNTEITSNTVNNNFSNSKLKMNKERQDSSILNNNKENFPSRFNYLQHDYISISYKIITKLKIKTQSVDLICIRFFDIILEKFPFLSIQKLISPFCDSLLDKFKLSYYKLSKTYPSDLSKMISFCEIIDKKKFTTDTIMNILKINMYSTMNMYCNNDIDFQLYYYTIKEENDQMNFIEKQVNNDYFMNDDEKLEVNNNYGNLKDVKFNLNNYFKSPLESYMNKRLEKNLYSNLLSGHLYEDDVEAVEDEFNNIYIGFLKTLIEEFSNFFFNKPMKNIFLTVSFIHFRE